MMSQKIRLTWIGSDNKTVVEECLLISEDDQIFSNDGEPAPDLMEKMAKIDFVVFEDSVGIFCLHPKSIINIDIFEPPIYDPPPGF